MTSEQTIQWKEAILPLAERLSGEQWEAEKALLTLLPDLEKILRFQSILGDSPFDGWEVPAWARKLYMSLLLWRQDHLTESWVPWFALRAKAALIGIPLTTPDADAQEAVYQRVFVRFAHEALRPFAEWKLPPKDVRRKAYQPIIVLCDACKGFTPPADEFLWRFHYQHLTSLSRGAQGPEASKACQLADYLFTEIIVQLQIGEVESSGPPYAFSGPNAAYLLNRQHQWRLHGQESATPKEGPNYTELIARAYLTALDAECPPPDWLP